MSFIKHLLFFSNFKFSVAVPKSNNGKSRDKIDTDPPSGNNETLQPPRNFKRFIKSILLGSRIFSDKPKVNSVKEHCCKAEKTPTEFKLCVIDASDEDELDPEIFHTFKSSSTRKNSSSRRHFKLPQMDLSKLTVPEPVYNNNNNNYSKIKIKHADKPFQYKKFGKTSTKRRWSLEGCENGEISISDQFDEETVTIKPGELNPNSKNY